jgi:chromosome partitioning protein
LWDHDPRFLQSIIPYAADIEKMGLHREPVAVFAPRSLSAQAYRDLWDELQARLFETTSAQANRT